MNGSGYSIYLEMDVNSLVYRLVHSDKRRPLIEGKDEANLRKFVKQHLEERKEYYQQAKMTVNAFGMDSKKIKILADTLLEESSDSLS